MMAIPIEGFGGSCYLDNSNRPMEDCVYSFGIDPRWYRSKSAITFVNSLKMKLSVIFAISQMSLGVLMKAFNASYFNSKIDFICEFIPQIILMLSLFGYMDLLIIIKWLTNYSGKESIAPSIINTMINIPLKGAYIEGQAFISDSETNETISLILLLIAVICVPIMLIPKPVILIWSLEEHDEQEDHKQVHDFEEVKSYEKIPDIPDELPSNNIQDHTQSNGNDKNFISVQDRFRQNSLQEHRESSRSGELMDASFEFKRKYDIIRENNDHGHSASEIFIHQLIETIEYVLGTISNTASYLRLWALSLAHSQLAGVFFELVLWSGIKAENPISIFIGFLIFGSATFAVLM